MGMRAEKHESSFSGLYTVFGPRPRPFMRWKVRIDENFEASWEPEDGFSAKYTCPKYRSYGIIIRDRCRLLDLQFFKKARIPVLAVAGDVTRRPIFWRSAETAA
jgi:hypothetical protein